MVVVEGCGILLIVSILAGQTAGSRAKITAKISSEWVESCPYKGMATVQAFAKMAMVDLFQDKMDMTHQTSFKMPLHVQSTYVYLQCIPEVTSQ